MDEKEQLILKQQYNEQINQQNGKSPFLPAAGSGGHGEGAI